MSVIVPHLLTSLRYSRAVREGQCVRTFLSDLKLLLITDVTIGLDQRRFVLRLNTVGTRNSAVGNLYLLVLFTSVTVITSGNHAERRNQ